MENVQIERSLVNVLTWYLASETPPIGKFGRSIRVIGLLEGGNYSICRKIRGEWFAILPDGEQIEANVQKWSHFNRHI